MREDLVHSISILFIIRHELNLKPRADAGTRAGFRAGSGSVTLLEIEAYFMTNVMCVPNKFKFQICRNRAGAVSGSATLLKIHIVNPMWRVPNKVKDWSRS